MIRIRIRSWNGAECEGVLLSLHGLEMRVAVAGSDDVGRLWSNGAQWFGERGDPVEIDFPAAATEPGSRGARTLDKRNGAPAAQWLN
jgi:hypothetical protein